MHRRSPRGRRHRGLLDRVQARERQRRPHAGHQIAAEHIGGVVPAEDDQRVSHRGREGPAGQGGDRPPRRRHDEHRAQCQRHRRGGMAARKRGIADLAIVELLQEGVEAGRREGVLEHLGAGAGDRQERGDRHRPPGPPLRQRDNHQTQAGEGIWQRITETDDEEQRVVDARALEGHEALQQRGVVLVCGRNGQREDRRDGEADEARQRSEQRDRHTGRHDGQGRPPHLSSA
jgi:hypothetical protein